MMKSLVSASTAHSDTTEKLIDTIAVPDGVSKIIGIQAHAVGGAGITTVENVTGKFRLRNDSTGDELEFLLDCIVVLTSGVAAFIPSVQPCDMPVTKNDQIKGYITMDLAQTVANTCRFRLIFN